ncbi:MAG: hypothetical protein F6K00_12475 [Leptolyngbya sp. SIOISBB]|nr:hypothetical protein [Leptolyngbya sp. SIOISBB]
MALTPKTPETQAGQEARQQYLELAQQVIGDAQVDYTALYQRFAENDWAAVKLDDAVALKGLKAGHSPKTVAGILHQSPYVQHQVHHNRVPVAPMSQYVRSTVMKVLQQWKQTQASQAQPSQRRQQQTGMDLE